MDTSRGVEFREHPNYTRQKQEAARRVEERRGEELARDAVAAQGERLKAAIFELLADTGYQLDFDTWGDDGIVLRHYHQVKPNDWRPSRGYDHQVSLDRD